MKFLLFLLGINFCLTFEIKFLLYTKYDDSSTSSTGFDLTPDSIHEMNSKFNPVHKTYLVVHGFTSSANNSWINKVKERILLAEDVNFIAVDWSQGAKLEINGIYTQAANNTKVVGEKIALFLVSAKIQPKSVHCLGHSLGAYCCSYAGKINRLGRITGLDPAAPLFNNYFVNTNRLTKKDAFLVDVIHTSVYGLQFSCGHQGIFIFKKI